MSSYHARYAARIGVLTPGLLYLPSGVWGAGLDETPRAIAARHNLDQLWLFGAGLDETPRAIAARHNLDQVWLFGDEPVPAGAVHWDQRGAEPAVVYPVLDQAAPWRDASSPQELLAALQMFNDALGRPYAYSPARTGAVLADATMPRPRQPVAEWPEPATRPNTVSDPHMVRELHEVPAGSWLHCYDKNAMYLAACSSVELGLGGLETRDGPTQIDAALPGYWMAADGWYTTPAVRYQLETVDSPWPVARAAYVWTEHNRALRTWYERIRDARAVLMEAAAIRTPGAALALRVLKLVYTHTIGWWRSRRGRDASSPQYRPDWRHMIMATAHANMRRQIAKCDAAGYAPLAWVGVDTLCFLSEYRDWPDAWEERGYPLSIGDGVGQWKHKTTLPPTTVDAIWALSGRERVRALVREIQL